jgi:F0F1-type ATP synthase assembly protein I
MPSLEQVCKRLFSDQSWFLKTIVGALLLIIPIAHFLAFGYLYALIEQARRGEDLEFPEWGDWRRTFLNGVAAFVIFVVLGAVPILVTWLLVWPLTFLHYGVFVYLPLVPTVMLAGPLTVAAIYQYQKREELRDAFRIYILISMLRSTKSYFWVPTFALIGFLVAGIPLMTFTVFVGLAASWTYYAVTFRFVEESRKRGVRA